VRAGARIALAALLLLGPGALPANDGLGRLFTTPDQRERMGLHRGGRLGGVAPAPRLGGQRPAEFGLKVLPFEAEQHEA